MHDHGILTIPDFIANAGGVICAAVEYQGGTQQQALTTIAKDSAPTRQKCWCTQPRRDYRPVRQPSG